jgi:hypothetical protein
MKWLVDLPADSMPQRAKNSRLAKGRAICRDELDRILDKADVVGVARPEEWRFYR